MLHVFLQEDEVASEKAPIHILDGQVVGQSHSGRFGCHNFIKLETCYAVFNDDTGCDETLVEFFVDLDRCDLVKTFKASVVNLDFRSRHYGLVQLVLEDVITSSR